MIYPGKRWIHRSGKGLEQFGYNQINDVKLSLLEFFPDSTDLFKNVGIADGLSIVFKDKSKRTAGFDYIYSIHGHKMFRHIDAPGDELVTLDPSDAEITNCITHGIIKYKFSYLADSIFPRNLFSIESSFVEENPTLVREYNIGDTFDKDSEIKLFTNDKAGKAGRARWYIAKKEIIKTNANLLPYWKVVVSSANAGGQKRSNQIAIIDNYSAFGRSRVALKVFKTKREAENFYKYATSDFIRYTFLLTDESLTSLAKQVPDIIDYTDNNAYINFSEDISTQLYNLFDISTHTQKHIKDTISDKETK